MFAGKFRLGTTQKRERPQLFGPNMQIEIKPTITGHPVGLVIAIGLWILLWVALPGVRMFLLGAVALGGVIGALLWWKHR
jgi:hypothetical protein